MDALSLGKELAETESKNIVAQTPKEELLKAIFQAKLPRIRKDYEKRLLALAQKHFDITNAEFESLDQGKMKTLIEYILEKARKAWPKESNRAVMCLEFHGGAENE